jgi:YVTN family beta-propeller protein
MFTRRWMIGGGVKGGLSAALGCWGCGRADRPAGFPGLAFIANSDGKAVAAVDLTAFAVVRHIRLDGNPVAVEMDPSRPYVYALVPDTGEVARIGTQTLAVEGRVRLHGRGVWMRLAPDGGALWVACEDGKVVRVELDKLTVSGQWQLGGAPAALDVSVGEAARKAEIAALALGREVVLLRPGSAKAERMDPGGSAKDLGLVTFRKDGRSLMAADRETGELWVFDLASRKVVVRLALGLRPRHYCVKPDGGEVHLTGEGSDALVTVFPYLTEVRGTVLAGRSPGFVAVSPANQILVANPESNDVTIVNGRNQRVLGVAPVGREPCSIAVTPDSAFALVLNRLSGDVSVLRLGNLEARRPSAAPAAPALTMIPVGSRPVSVAIG